ncbi:MAG: methyltransferase domain-containing protein [Nitrososphaeria archaeon]|nr:methyltransferase domain-containing protein [Aigarchaeota archaeon]MCX8187087.1 methyltransferase domain-containing protein [Nitrososphaeria archaeon]
MNLRSGSQENKNGRQSLKCDKISEALLKEFHDKIRPDYYDNPRFAIQRIWHRRRFQLIKSLLKEDAAKNEVMTLDIGCNGGTFTNIIKQSVDDGLMIGIDIGEQGVMYAAKKYPDIMFLIADACHLPFRENSFDLITCLEVLEHLTDPLKCLMEINRCLKPKREAIILVPRLDSLLFKIVWYVWINTGGRDWKEAHTTVIRNKKNLKLLVERAGLKIIREKSSHLGMLMAFKVKKP